MRIQDKADRRERGDGSLVARPNAKGGETWLGKWRIDGRGVTRVVGHKRSKAHPEGLTRSQAEAEFRRMRDAAELVPEAACSAAQSGKRATTPWIRCG